MKQLNHRWTAVTLLVLMGCSQGTPGGPGTTDVTTKKPVLGQTEDTFNLSVPRLSTTLQQGEAVEVEVAIERATNFGQDVALTFTELPTGVTISPDTLTIKHGDASAKITLTATDGVVPGDYIIKVVGHPDKGGDAQVDLKITVTAMDSFTIGVPLLSASLKQGESTTVSISIDRDGKFNQDVTLSFGEMPTGVTLEPSSSVIKQGQSELEITLSAASDAALGDFTIEVTGSPESGREASKELKLSVVEK